MHSLTTEVFAVMTQLIIYVFKLSIKLIFLGFLSLIEILVSYSLFKRVTYSNYKFTQNPINKHYCTVDFIDRQTWQHRDCLANNLGV